MEGMSSGDGVSAHHPSPEKTSSDEIGKPCSISHHDHTRCQKKHRARAQDDIERARPTASSEVFANARPMFFREQVGEENDEGHIIISVCCKYPTATSR